MSLARSRVGDTKVIGPGERGAVGTLLIPALNGSSNGIEDDGDIQGLSDGLVEAALQWLHRVQGRIPLGGATDL